MFQIMCTTNCQDATTVTHLQWGLMGHAPLTLIDVPRVGLAGPGLYKMFY